MHDLDSLHAPPVAGDLCPPITDRSSHLSGRPAPAPRTRHLSKPPAHGMRRQRARASRGVALQGCMILLAALTLVTTFAMYNAEKVEFHITVAILAAVGTTWMTVRNRIPEAAAFAAIGLPALISAGLGYTGRLAGDDLKGSSGLIYIVGCILYVAHTIWIGLRHEGPGEPTDDDSSSKGS
jgi:hypothetical protein